MIKIQNMQRKVYDIIGSNCAITPQNVTALKINKETENLNLINEELQELNTEMIDEISDSVNEEYMELYYLLLSENDGLQGETDGEKDKSKSKDNKNKEKDATTLSLEKYTAYFEKLENGKKVNLKDLKSDQNAFMPIEVCDEKVYMTEPDGKLIQNIDNQQKCDFMIYCQNLPQTCFIELKGANISNKKIIIHMIRL
ncbi:MAG: hypothetical protein ACLR8X_08265 [Gallintestinimicrobium sp.]